MNNTNLSNIRWENNTVVSSQGHRHQSVHARNGVHGHSSGQTGGALSPDSVFLTNDCFVVHGFDAQDYVAALDSNLVVQDVGLEQVSFQKGTRPRYRNRSASWRW